jgi:hypothetical protein
MWHAWERRENCRFWWEIPKARDHSEKQGVDGRMGSEGILGRLAEVCVIDSAGSGYGTSGGDETFSFRRNGVSLCLLLRQAQYVTITITG